jgi:porin
MFLRTDLLEGRVNFAFGRMAIGDKFATSSIFYNYVSLTFDENPISILINDPGFFSNPEAAWGAWLRGSPVDEIYLMAGVYNSNPRLGRDNAHGVNFSFRGGAIFIGEIGYLHNHKSGSNKKPGTYKFGAYYGTGSFTPVDNDVDNSETNEDGNYGFYVIGEQMVYRERATSDQGLTSWAALTYAPQQEINTFPLFVSGGLVYQGLFKPRDRDKTALAFAYGRVSDNLQDKDFEILFEATHIIEITNWVDIQPDIQYIVHPGGSGEIPDALVVGVMLAVDI